MFGRKQAVLIRYQTLQSRCMLDVLILTRMDECTIVCLFAAYLWQELVNQGTRHPEVAAFVVGCLHVLPNSIHGILHALT